MARTTLVKAARQAQGNCAVCGKALEAGQPYKWTHPRYRGRIKACQSCVIPRSMTSSAKTAGLDDSIAAFSAGQDGPDFEALASDLENLAEEVRGVGEEYQEGADNQREYFPDSEQAQESEDKANALEEFADNLDNAKSEVETLGEEAEEEPDEGDYEPEEPEEEIGPEKAKQAKDDWIQAKMDENLADKWQEAQDLAQSAVDDGYSF